MLKQNALIFQARLKENLSAVQKTKILDSSTWGNHMKSQKSGFKCYSYLSALEQKFEQRSLTSLETNLTTRLLGILG